MGTDGVIKAAGALLWRQPADDGRAHLAVVHRPHRQDWSFPKGKLEPGEHAVAAAVREVAEETGWVVALGRPLPTLRYDAEGAPKQVRYWAAEPDDWSPRPFVPGPEIDELEWLAADAARERLTYPHDTELIAAFERRPVDTVPLVVLRHAKAVKRGRWTDADPLRPLDGRGTAQAGRLVAMLGAYGIRRVHSSDSERCRATVAPYAKARGVPVEEEPTLSEEAFDRKPKATRKRLTELLAQREPLVVCTHRPVLPELVDTLVPRRRGRVPAPLTPGTMLVVHRDVSGKQPRVVAVERHRS
jgi:8-oxo-dGTP diphosphatase